MKQIRVALYYNNRDIRIKKIPIPKVGCNDVLIKVRVCGICGSDIMEWYRMKKAPLVLGHEVVGAYQNYQKKQDYAEMPVYL